MKDFTSGRAAYHIGAGACDDQNPRLSMEGTVQGDVLISTNGNMTRESFFQCLARPLLDHGDGIA